MKTAKSYGKGMWRSGLFWFFGVLLVILLLVEFVVTPLVHRKLIRNFAKLPDHRAEIRDLDLHLWKNEVVLKDFALIQKSGPKELVVIFFPEVRSHLAGSSLLKGRIELSLEFKQPKLSIIKGETYPSGFSKEVASAKMKEWQKVMDEILPLKIHDFKVEGATVEFIVPKGSNHDLALSITHVDVEADELTTGATSEGELIGSTYVTATLPGKGTVTMKVKLDSTKYPVSFDMEVGVSDMDVTAYNAFLKEFAKIDLEKGTFNLTAVAKARNSLVNGHVTPIFSEIKLKGKHDSKDSLLNKFWESVVNVGIGIASDESKKDAAPNKMPFDGELKDPEMKVMQTVQDALKMIFERAFTFSKDQNVSKK